MIKLYEWKLAYKNSQTISLFESIFLKNKLGLMLVSDLNSFIKWDWS